MIFNIFKVKQFIAALSEFSLQGGKLFELVCENVEGVGLNTLPFKILKLVVSNRRSSLT